MSSDKKQDLTRDEALSVDDAEVHYQVPDGGLKACLSLAGQSVKLNLTRIAYC